tara:strand:+ start:103 stop:693 length:591 start_codon:yes stop_codon:yes gene_type:complete
LSNAFDSDNYPTQVPTELKLGDYFAWKINNLSADYPNSGYVLSYEFNLIDGATPANITLTATNLGADYKVEVASSVTASYTKGEYNWIANITVNGSSNRVKVGEGFVTLQDNYAATTASVRSHAKIVLDSILAVIENRATMDQSSMSIAGRSLSRMTIDELLKFKSHYKTEYLKEVKQARILNGMGSGNTVKVRFK